MGVKDLKNRKNINITLDKELLEFVDKYARQTGIPKTRIHDKALEILREKVEKGENIYK
jgi:transcription initiation factor TFIIIB Brf1 subunit/transcription initiation factor TFIIB